MAYREAAGRPKGDAMNRHGCILVAAGLAILPLMLGAGPTWAEEDVRAGDVKVYRDVPTPEDVTKILNRPLRMRGIEFPKVQPPQGTLATPAAATAAAPSADPTAPQSAPPPAAVAAAAPVPSTSTGRQVESARAIAFHLNFAFNSAEIVSDAMPYLDAVGTALKSDQLANAVVVVEGHTDAVGSDAYNQLLSQRRAESVQQYLVEKFKLNPKKLIAVGKGKAELLDPSSPQSGTNRRVQFHRAE